MVGRVGLIGAGAVGASLVAMLREADIDVRVIADGRRAERLRTVGLSVNGSRFSPVVDETPSATDYRLVIVATKSTHLSSALPLIRSAAVPPAGASRPASVLSLLNGISSEQIIRDALGPGSETHVVPAMILGIDAVRDDDAVTYLNRGTIYYGADAESAPVGSDRLAEISAILTGAAIPTEQSADIIRTLWWKFMINVGINQASAILRGSYGLFQRSEHARALMSDLMQEVIVLSRAAGTGLSEDDLSRWLETLKTLNPEGKTSMLQDVLAGRTTEIDLFAETVVRLGNEYSVPTPVNRTLLHAIRALEERSAER